MSRDDCGDCADLGEQLDQCEADAEEFCQRIAQLEAEMQWPIPPAWAGESLMTMLHVLAGALSTVMLPHDQEMPSEAILEMIDRVLRDGAR